MIKDMTGSKQRQARNNDDPAHHGGMLTQVIVGQSEVIELPRELTRQQALELLNNASCGD